MYGACGAKRLDRDAISKDFPIKWWISLDPGCRIQNQARLDKTWRRIEWNGENVWIGLRIGRSTGIFGFWVQLKGTGGGGLDCTAQWPTSPHFLFSGLVWHVPALSLGAWERLILKALLGGDLLGSRAASHKALHEAGKDMLHNTWSSIAKNEKSTISI